jgi:hypothetical protein
MVHSFRFFGTQEKLYTASDPLIRAAYIVDLPADVKGNKSP